MAIREAAIRVFAKHGFKAASLRMLAKEVGIQAPSLYNYIKSKERLLFDLLRDVLVALLAEIDAANRGLTDPVARLRNFVQIHLDFHLDSRLEVFVGNMELRNLTKPHYKVVTGLRDGYSGRLTAIVEDGVRTGVFEAVDARVLTFAVLAMLTGVCNWYRPDGRMSKQDLVRIHTDLAFKMLGARAGLEATAEAPGAARPLMV
ncbi:MAG: hypothetical protein BGO72_16535 [Burkholderiales bacterium 70-64]|nr:MAG: hypothetical protein BGO72_16535 [Burkholderiales bacterium 70-64]